MLDVAHKYSNELSHKFLNVMYDDKYKFFDSGWSDVYSPSDGNWNQHEFVSMSSDGKILGYISYHINRNAYYAYGLKAINFSDDKITFGRDLFLAIEDVFLKYNFNKLNFSVFVGNPIEKTYDKLISKHGGRVVGVKKQESKLLDGRLYDLKLYEIMKDDFK